MISTACADYGYLTSEIRGTGGAIKESPDDFLVEEIPAYKPSGTGEHLYLTIEKRGITTLEAVRLISRQFKVNEKDIGYAGMKDAVGVTRQTLSVPGIKAESVLGREFGVFKVLAAAPHGNKLKLGHLKGNRFSIVVRDVSSAASDVESIMQQLISRGVPNWFGYQRYGIQNNSHLIGQAMLRRDWRAAVDILIGDAALVDDQSWKDAINAYRGGDSKAAAGLMPRHCRTEREVLQRLISRPEAFEKAFAAVHPRLRNLYLSAFQSRLFDMVVALRLSEIDAVWPGDLACKHVNGVCFLVLDAEAESPRASCFEISATGPMFGSRMKQPQGRALELENHVVEQYGLRLDDFCPGGVFRLEGERRPIRVPLTDASYKLNQNLLELEFTLPRGSYATSVVREFTKNF